LSASSGPDETGVVEFGPRPESAVHGASGKARQTSWVLLPGGLHTSTESEENTMFEDQKVELLPARTTMYTWGSYNQNYNTAVAAAANVLNVNVGGDQYNDAYAAAAAGSNFYG
jgi:hypothetical protein